jgi:phosphotransferase system HPr (HPr) family protein
MIEYTLQSNTFFEARPAALFVQTASKFVSCIHLQVGNKNANAKSIMGVISLGIDDGSAVTILAEGEDEELVAPALEQFFRKAPALS